MPVADVRPGRSDIAIPPFPPGLTWIGTDDPISERLTARGPVLVHFFEVGELSSVRTLPFVQGLADALGSGGLTVLGVHSPRSALAQSDEALAAAVERLGIRFPVGNDDGHRIWHQYGCKGWPSTFLWGQGGILRYAHFGEGAYHETEAEIRAELAAKGSALPDPIAPEPPKGKPPKIEHPSDEIFPGGSHDVPWAPSSPGEPMIVEYAGGGAWAAMDGEGTVQVSVDGKPSASIELTGPGLYELSSHHKHGIHEVGLVLDGEIRVWSVAFSPGVR